MKSSKKKNEWKSSTKFVSKSMPWCGKNWRIWKRCVVNVRESPAETSFVSRRSIKPKTRRRKRRRRRRYAGLHWTSPSILVRCRNPRRRRRRTKISHRIGRSSLSTKNWSWIVSSFVPRKSFSRITSVISITCQVWSDKLSTNRCRHSTMSNNWPLSTAFYRSVRFDRDQTRLSFIEIDLGSEKVHETAPQVKGLLLCGPRGCGKHMLLHAICNELGANLFDISPQNIYENYRDKEGMKMVMHLCSKVSQSIVGSDSQRFSSSDRWAKPCSLQWSLSIIVKSYSRRNWNRKRKRSVEQTISIGWELSFRSSSSQSDWPKPCPNGWRRSNQAIECYWSVYRMNRIKRWSNRCWKSSREWFFYPELSTALDCVSYVLSH